MHKRQLGRDGPMVSAIGVGAMSFAGIYGTTTEAEAHTVLARALELGIDHIDTANVYGGGVSETYIGSFLKARGGPNPFRIATKASIRRDPDGTRRFDNSAAHLTDELDKSLGRLGVDVIDLYYIHRRDTALEIEEVTETLKGFIQAGKIRAFGYSEIAPSSLRRADTVHPVAAVQSEYSLSTRFPELGLLQETERQGTALVAFSPVGRGLLSDVELDDARLAASSFLSTTPRFQEPNLSANRAYAARFRTLAAEMGTTAASLAIAWLLAKGPHVIPIPGTRSVAHLEELAAGADLRLSPADLDAIETVLPVGWAHGDRYSDAQWVGPERYC